jgi:hypothetical protein
MKKTISFFTKGKALWCGLLLTGGMLLVGTNSASAQQSANGTVNPHTHIAAKLNVTAYPLGTMERTHSMDVLENILNGMKQIVSNGGGTSYQKLKYAYCSAVLGDISTKYIAVELSLLTQLSGFDAVKSTTGTQQSQLATLYNEVVSQLQ